SALNRVDLPTFGRPTMPQRMAMKPSLRRLLSVAASGRRRARRWVTRMQAIHGFLWTFRDDHRHDVGGGFDRLANHLRVLARGPSENVIQHHRTMAGMADADAHPPEVIAEVGDHIAQAVAAASAAFLHLHLPGWEIQLVMRHQDGVELHLVEAREAAG